jgi:hypothetical protein
LTPFCFPHSPRRSPYLSTHPDKPLGSSGVHSAFHTPLVARFTSPHTPRCSHYLSTHPSLLALPLHTTQSSFSAPLLTFFRLIRCSQPSSPPKIHISLLFNVQHLFWHHVIPLSFRCLSACSCKCSNNSSSKCPNYIPRTPRFENLRLQRPPLPSQWQQCRATWTSTGLQPAQLNNRKSELSLSDSGYELIVGLLHLEFA